MQPHWVDVDLLLPTHQQPAITQHAHKCSVSSYMLLLFPGELTERFLFWLMEPPMATAESASDLLQMLRSLCVLHLRVASSSRRPARPLGARCHIAPHD